MLDRVNVCLLGRVIAAALVFGTPQAVLSQSLNVTCNSNALFASGLCDNQDMSSVEDVVNANEAAVADAQSTADQAAATNRVQDRQINRNNRIATTARRTANEAVATNRVQQRQINTSIANISANRTAIATNAGDIAANTTAIEDLKIDFAGLRTEVS